MNINNYLITALICLINYSTFLKLCSFSETPQRLFFLFYTVVYHNDLFKVYIVHSSQEYCLDYCRFNTIGKAYRWMQRYGKVCGEVS